MKFGDYLHAATPHPPNGLSALGSLPLPQGERVRRPRLMKQRPLSPPRERDRVRGRLRQSRNQPLEIFDA